MADTNSQYEYNIDVFKAVIGLMFDVNKPENQGWITEMFNLSKPQVDSGINSSLVPDIILKSGKAPAQFQERFSAMLKANADAEARGEKAPFTTIASYTTAEDEYSAALRKRTGFESYATLNNIKKFIENGTSVIEVGDRIDNAYNAINNADAALKAEIKKMFPASSDADLAKTLLTGDTKAMEQQNKFAAAAIAAEATTAGIKSELNATQLEDVAKQGLTREQARAGYRKLAQEQQGIKQAAVTFGQQAITQADLEQEALGLTQSEKIKSLRSQARAEFGGQSGIQTGSLSRKKQV